MRSRVRSTVAALAVCFVVLVVASPVRPASRTATFSRSGLHGSAASEMQSVTISARVGRVAYDSSTKEFWGVGPTLAQRPVPGWDATSPGGQIVFLRRVAGRWRIEGAPVDSRGRAVNPSLYAVTLAGGHGWAVGAGGIVLHKAAGSTVWRVDEAATQVAGGVRLTSVSARATTGGITVFAVGLGGLVLRHTGGAWTRDSAPVITEDLGGIAAVSATDAWATSAPSANDVSVYRRTSAGWSRITLDPMFGGPHPAQASSGAIIDRASSSSIVADSSGAWVGGTMFPRDAVHLFGDSKPGDTSRPFALRITTGGATAGYCPDLYGVRREAGEVVVDTRVVCANPFPLTAFDLTSFSLLPGGEVFAGGLGLFRFKNGGWSREPDTIGYLSSVAFASSREGWAATTGSTFGGGLAIHSSESVVGHWTSAPEKASVARWPQPQQQPLHGIAVAPDGSGRALAVGEEGAVLLYIPEVGWDYQIRVTVSSVHAVAWSSPDDAWGVGEQGVIQHYDGVRWHDETPAFSKLGLYDVAFSAPNRGVAVGLGGTVLLYDGIRWTPHPQSGKFDRALYSVATKPDGSFVAVGEDGLVLESHGGVLAPDAAAASALARRRPGAPTLNAVAVAPDGTVYAAGARSALIVRRPGARFAADPVPPEGNIVDLAASAGLLFASVSPDASKFRGDRLGATRTVAMVREAGAWRDLSLSRRRTIYPGVDSSTYNDPIFSISLDAGGRTGWAAGGFPASTPDSDGHLRQYPTSSVYRIDLDHDPSPGFDVPDIDLPEDGFSFAFFGESWCGLGVCSNSMGSGTQADLVAREIQDQVNALSGKAGGPRFVLYSGNARASGIPEELAQAKAYFRQFDAPLFAAQGDRDLFSGLEGTSIGNATVGALQGQAAGVPEYWMEEFASMPAPWGTGRAPAHNEPVGVAGESAPRSGMARTHYAFDYVRDGVKLLRVVVLDTSTKSFGRTDGSDQNPPDRQDGWLSSVYVDTKLQNNNRGVPMIVLMNQPTNVPDFSPQPNWSGNPTDATTFQNTAVANAVSGVFAGGLRVNARDGYPSPDAPVVPVFIAGGGGAPLGYEPPNQAARAPSKLPTDGFYNAWHLVTVRPGPAGALARATMQMRTFPVLDSVAMHAVDGRDAGAGNTLRFAGIARSLSGGDSDPEQSRSTYYTLGSGGLYPCEAHGQGYGACASKDAVNPPYRFWSEDPSIANFVEPLFGSEAPKLDPDTELPIPEKDGLSGLLCTFKAGSTYINVESGFRRARMKVTVGGGFGPCIKKPVIVPDVKQPVPQVFSPQPVEPAPHGFFRPLAQNQALALFPPPPAPVIAPAPPGAPGVGKKEEHEVQTETEGHGENYGFTALPRRRSLDPVDSSWVYLGTVALLSFMSAAVLATRRERRPAWERDRGTS